MTTTCVEASEDAVPIAKSGNLELSLGSSSTAALAYLRANPALASRVRKVVVQHSNTRGISSPTKEDLIGLFEEIGRVCPQIETLRVALDITGNRDSPSIALPVSALTAFFQQTPTKLAALKLSAVISADGVQDFQLLEDAIRENAPSGWKEVRLEFCEPAPGTASLDPLIRALSSASTLEQAHLSGTNMTHINTCTGPSLVKLVTENELKVLTIWGGKRLLDGEDTLALIRALETNTSLTELTLHARGLCPIIGRALAHCLCLNTTLERLILSVRDACPRGSFCSQPKSDYATSATFLADALRLHNRTLRMLSLDCSTEDEEMLAMGDSHDHDFFEYELMDARASLWRSHVHEVSQAFTSMLHCNTVLEVLGMNLDNEQEEEEEEEENYAGLLTSEMDMLLRLNRYGIRQRLFEGAPEATSLEWLNALASQKDDPNALYYLLSRNPSLCYSSSRPGTKRKTEANEASLQASKRQKTSG